MTVASERNGLGFEGSWVVISRVISRVARLITLLRGLITSHITYNYP